MAKLALLALALIAGSTNAVFRIKGGEPAEIEDYPSLVQVESMSVNTGIWGQSCAANILNSVYVLSAAHCFHGIPNGIKSIPLYAPTILRRIVGAYSGILQVRYYESRNRRIRAGTTYRESGGIVSYVQIENNHPSYGPNGHDGDITVVRLITPLEFSDVVSQGTIVASDWTPPDYLPVTHAGWGAISQGGASSSVLLDTTIYTVNHDVCAERYSNLSIPETVTENMICAGLLDVGGRAACQGDGGGPLYYQNIIIGIISWGHGCADDSLPGVSTAVSSYSDWIISVAL